MNQYRIRSLVIFILCHSAYALPFRYECTRTQYDGSKSIFSATQTDSELSINLEMNWDLDDKQILEQAVAAMGSDSFELKPSHRYQLKIVRPGTKGTAEFSAGTKKLGYITLGEAERFQGSLQNLSTGEIISGIVSYAHLNFTRVRTDSWLGRDFNMDELLQQWNVYFPATKKRIATQQSFSFNHCVNYAR